jgi:hypothetical protein
MEKLLENRRELSIIINDFQYRINTIDESIKNFIDGYYLDNIHLEEFNKNDITKIFSIKDTFMKDHQKLKNIYKIRLNTLRDEYIEIEKAIEEETKKELDRKKTEGCKTLNELYYILSNNYQKDIFTKIMNDREYAKIYLSKYNPNNTGKNQDMLGTINVLGTLNLKKQERETYDIKLYRQSDKGTFWCSCPDHKFNSGKKGTVCKHICFIVCKILKYLNKDFFDTKKLPDEQIEQLVAKLTTNNMCQIDKSLIKEIKKISLELFMNFVRPIEEGDSCPICFDDINSKDKLACPSCHNYIHNDCMEVILENRNNCLWCQDDIWSKYKILKRNII